MQIFTGIISTTHIDAHNERMAKEALDSMAAQIRERYVPNLVNHDPDQQIGVALYAEVIPLEDGEHALIAVLGVFESEDEFLEYRASSANTVWKDYARYLDGVREEAVRQVASRPPFKPPTVDPDDIAQLLEIHLNSTSIWTDGTVYKVKYLIGSINDLKIEVRPRDHKPDHFHVSSTQRGINASFDFDTLDPIKGEVSIADTKKIKDFFKRNPDKLKKLREARERMSGNWE